MNLIRSWMFVPGHRQRMIDKALGVSADAIMLDIEDGVAPNEKDTARNNIAESLGREKAPGSPARYVRINAIGHARMDADLEAVIRPGLESLVCPKVDTPDEVRKIDAILNDREPKISWRRRG
jgi:citrate lyase subunit beta / citryl-CoA lyase